MNSNIYIDTDVAMGGPHGDVDDGFAIAATCLANLPISAIGSTFGNTSEHQAFQNLGRLLPRVQKREIPLLRGKSEPGKGSSESSHWLLKNPGIRILALGPLTNIANAVEAGGSFSEVILVGGNSSSPGRWPPFFPFEFNLTKDKWAVHVLFESQTPLTLVPLNVCGRFRLSARQINSLPGKVGEYLSSQSHRWLKRAFWLKAQNRIPVWDAVAAMYVVSPELFGIREGSVQIAKNTRIDFSSGHRPVKWITDYSPEKVFEKMCSLFES